MGTRNKKLQFPSTNPVASRVLSAFELPVRRIHRESVTTFFTLWPNEVHCFVCAQAWRRSGLRDGRWFWQWDSKRPVSWRRIFLIALVGGLGVRILLGQFVHRGRLRGFFWPPPSAPSIGRMRLAEMQRSRLLCSAACLGRFAAFGEEIAYRGYLLTRAADNRREIDFSLPGLGIVFVSILFGVRGIIIKKGSSGNH